MKKIAASFGAIAAIFSLALPLVAPVAVQAQTVQSGFCYTFTKNLGEGRTISAADANALQQVLTAQGFYTSGTPILSYTDTVASAVVGFQEKYASQILTPNGLSYGTGYVGASTRAELNALYGCPSTAYPTTTATNTTSTYTGLPSSFVCPPTWSCPTLYPNPVTTNPVSSNPCLTGDYSYCNPTTPASPYSPVLYSLSSSQVSTGQIVTLNGNNFSGSTEVHIGGMNGSDLSFPPNTVSPSGTSLSFSVPVALGQGSYTISVYNITSTNESSNSLNFTVVPASMNPAPVSLPISNPSNPSSPSYPSAASAAISLDAVSPLSGSVAVTNTTQGQYLSLPVLVFDLNAQGDNLHLHGVTVSIVGAGNGSINAAYLYNGSVQISSASVINGVATFSNITDGTTGATVPINAITPFTVKVDVSGLTGSGSQERVSASVVGSGLTVYNSADNAVGVSGSAQGSSISVVGPGSALSLSGVPSITKTNITPGAATTVTFQYSATFDVSVTAVGGNVTLGLPNSSMPAFTSNATSVAIYRNGSQDSLSNYNPTVTYQQPTATLLSSDGTSFTISQNQTVIIPVTYSFTVNNPGANFYAVQLQGVTSSSGLNNSMMNQSTWRTNSI